MGGTELGDYIIYMYYVYFLYSTDIQHYMQTFY
jgi:hypothetical protein